ncbi:MAG: homoserine dehydrogenase [Pirellulaceae bacterium]|jgi:homoserine dehydrogenase|nr:homoserine dehydrogenase [Pirellulaceae bacterium]MDP7018119.1 homoserine dehydrogenase [Pirellulaceae bacterium]
MLETVNVGIVGLGTVGTGVARLLVEHSDRLARRAGCRLALRHVVVRNLDKPRDVTLPSSVTMSADIESLIDNADVQVVIQLMGGLDPARSYMLRLLESGKDVVTANKALLAEHGAEMFARARELGRSIAFEASVAGGVPVIAGIGQCLAANEIKSLRGILNGTSNFIIGEMEQGADYGEAVAAAQRLGFAEADPTMDVDGSDAAQKLAILAHLAFGAKVQWSQIPRVGIDSLQVEDMRFARELGYRVKLLAVARRATGGVDLHVSPTLVKHTSPLADVREAFNAISVVGDAVGRVFFHGQGAGQMPTASAVTSDLIDTAVGRSQLTFQTLDLWSDRSHQIDVRERSLASSRFYLRFMIEDHPGVLALIAGSLGHAGVSISSVIQHEPDTAGAAVPLVIMTHTAREGAMVDALAQIEQLDSVHDNTVRMRVLD